MEGLYTTAHIEKPLVLLLLLPPPPPFFFFYFLVFSFPIGRRRQSNIRFFNSLRLYSKELLLIELYSILGD
jgi:hypothetical protein